MRYMGLTELLVSFVADLGLTVYCEPIDKKTFLPGILIRNGALVVDKERLSYPGDLLHEAGHLAVMPLSIRQKMNDDLGNDDLQKGGEMMAIAWSYAACVHLNIDPHIVFHEQGYKGGGKNIVRNFEEGQNIGLPLLQWQGMAYDVNTAKQLNVKPFPYMVSWLCMKDNYRTEEVIERDLVTEA